MIEEKLIRLGQLLNPQCWFDIDESKTPRPEWQAEIEALKAEIQELIDDRPPRSFRDYFGDE